MSDELAVEREAKQCVLQEPSLRLHSPYALAQRREGGTWSGSLGHDAPRSVLSSACARSPLNEIQYNVQNAQYNVLVRGDTPLHTYSTNDM